MTQFLTRRELREAERKGLVLAPADSNVVEELVAAPADNVAEIQLPIAEAEAPLIPEALVESQEELDGGLVEESSSESDSLVSAEEEVEVELEVEAPILEAPASPPAFLTRRQLRELEQSGKAVPAQKQPEVSEPDSLPRDTESEPELPTAEEIAAIDQSSVDEELEATEIDLDMPSADFTGANFLAEPSTQSIILDVAPEAIALPIETGEVAITGSIAILAEPTTGSITGGLDGLALDRLEQQDAVTGVISIVEPISALSIINERVNVGVVPQSVLRRGWWRPWLIGLAGLLMAIAAILATITIINALGA